jgi:signal transduction histidine kinase
MLIGVVIILISGTVFVQSGVIQSLVIAELTSPGGLVDQLAHFYTQHENWEGVDTFLIERGININFPPDNGLTLLLTDPNSNMIFDPNPVPPPSGRVTDTPLPITVNGVLRGYLVLRRVTISPTNVQISGVWQRVISALLVVTVISGVLGIVAGTLMSRSLTAPLSRLAEAAQAIGARNLSRRVRVEGSKEVIELANAFNDMAVGLEQAEILRRNMVADIAHELRTPLSVLKGNLHALLDDVYPLTKTEISRLYDQTHLLSRLVNDLHELSQAEAKQLPLHWQEVDLARLLLEHSATFSPLFEETGITLNTDIAANAPHIHADPARIAQILGNLLMNAVAHTPRGGTVTVRLMVGVEALLLSVSDTGEGISAEHLPHVFDRFYRTDRSRDRSSGGAGLGLAIVRALTELHNGTVNVASEGIAGKGTTFTVRLMRGKPSPFA